MLIIDIKVLSGSEEVETRKALEKAGLGVQDLVITKETVEALGHMNLNEFNQVMSELKQTFLALKTTGGKKVLNR